MAADSKGHGKGVHGAAGSSSGADQAWHQVAQLRPARGVIMQLRPARGVIMQLRPARGVIMQLRLR